MHITHVPLFGFIAIYGLKNQVTDKSDNAECTDILQLHRMLRKDGRHNYKGLQVPVPSKINYDVWSKYLQQYWDWQLYTGYLSGYSGRYRGPFHLHTVG